MKSSEKYLCEGKYDQAIKAAEREIADPSTEETGVLDGVYEFIGMALMCLGRYDEAITYYADLRKRSIYTVASNSIGSGLACWFAGDKAEAFRHWRRGLKAQYAVCRGLDIRLIMYYAAVSIKDPKEIDSALSEIRKRLTPYQGIVGLVAQFLLGEVEEKVLYLEPSSHSKTGGQAPDDTEYAKFYVGVKALKDGNRRRFVKLMREASGFDLELANYVMIIARKELGLI